MHKGDALGMEGLSRKETCVLFLKGGAATTVKGVTKERMPKMRHMHADLMGAPRFETERKLGDASIAGKHGIVETRARYSR